LRSFFTFQAGLQPALLKTSAKLCFSEMPNNPYSIPMIFQAFCFCGFFQKGSTGKNETPALFPVSRRSHHTGACKKFEHILTSVLTVYERQAF